MVIDDNPVAMVTVTNDNVCTTVGLGEYNRHSMGMGEEHGKDADLQFTSIHHIGLLHVSKVPMDLEITLANKIKSCAGMRNTEDIWNY